MNWFLAYFSCFKGAYGIPENKNNYNDSNQVSEKAKIESLYPSGCHITTKMIEDSLRSFAYDNDQYLIPVVTSDTKGENEYFEEMLAELSTSLKLAKPEQEYLRIVYIAPMLAEMLQTLSNENIIKFFHHITSVLKLLPVNRKKDRKCLIFMSKEIAIPEQYQRASFHMNNNGLEISGFTVKDVKPQFPLNYYTLLKSRLENMDAQLTGKEGKGISGAKRSNTNYEDQNFAINQFSRYPNMTKEDREMVYKELSRHNDKQSPCPSVQSTYSMNASQYRSYSDNTTLSTGDNKISYSYTNKIQSKKPFTNGSSDFIPPSINLPEKVYKRKKLAEIFRSKRKVVAT